MTHSIEAGDKPYWWHGLTTVLVLTLMSAIWIESDAYRYALGFILLAMLVYYLRVDVWQADRIRVGPVGLIALAWGGYVLARYGLAASAQGQWSLGTAEGIYIFPVIYISTGYALYLMQPNIRWLMTGFILVTSLVLAGGFGAVTDNMQSAVNAVFANNTIHMSFGLGLVLTMHLHFLIYFRAQLRGLPIAPWLIYGLCAFNAALCLTYIILLNSKGVWLAVGAMLAAMTAIAVIKPQRFTRRGIVIGVTALLALGAVTVLAFSRLERVAGQTANSAVALSQDIIKDGLRPALARGAENEAVPESMRIRLQLLADSVTLAAERPLFGHGPGWLDRWDNRQYKQHVFNILHNSYFEILVRYGWLGLSFYALMFGWAIYQMARAQREGLTGPATVPTAIAIGVYFAVGAATNSHIRLAQGESVMLLYVAFGAYCYSLRQRAGTVIVKTWI